MVEQFVGHIKFWALVVTKGLRDLNVHKSLRPNVNWARTLCYCLFTRCLTLEVYFRVGGRLLWSNLPIKGKLIFDISLSLNHSYSLWERIISTHFVNDVPRETYVRLYRNFYFFDESKVAALDISKALIEFGMGTAYPKRFTYLYFLQSNNQHVEQPDWVY